MRQRIDLNRDWEFIPQFSDAFAAGADCGAEQVCLPHTCKETPYHYFDERIYQMVCGYRRVLHVPGDWAGKTVFLCVGAAGHRAEVFLNGEKLYEHRCGYTAFRVQLPVTPGEDALLVLRVDSRESQDLPPFGYVIDYMTYGGLYREVWLEIQDADYITDVFLKPQLPLHLHCGETAEQIKACTFTGLITTTVEMTGPTFNALSQKVYAPGSDTVLAEQLVSITPEIPAFTMTLPVRNVRLWDVESPTLYEVETTLLHFDQPLDTVRTTVGFRRAEFKADGFYLNGRKLRLRGLNRHQSWPYVGYAMPKRMQRLDADILKHELGLNAVRTSHYPQSHHFIDRCDELGLLVFTEIPGWQHIGGDAWKDQAVRNVEDMVRQYRNHPSIMLWGVRINESRDDDQFYRRTNHAARVLDPSRPTGGVRCHKKSSLLEDVYTYNDFVHDGTNTGCEPKKAVTSDMNKAYFISEYNGHMFPTKTWDSEEHRLEHALRHARVLDSVAGEADIAGSFGWCMFDYNTHSDFGSGDRICYHGVMDMFRNKKLAADVYSVQQDETPILNVSSSMDIGEHPAGNRGRVFLFTNADEVRMYQNDRFIRSYTHKDTPYKHMTRPPIEVRDYIGDRILEGEDFPPTQAKFVKDMLNHSARFGMNHLPADIMAKAGVLMARYRMTFDDAYRLYGKYIGNWGDAATVYRFEAVKDGKVVATVLRAPAQERRLRVDVSHTHLTEDDTWDAAAIRLALTDQNGNVLPFYQGAVELQTEGPIQIIGPRAAMLRGGLGGTYVKTTGQAGQAALILTAEGLEPVRAAFEIEKKSK